MAPGAIIEIQYFPSVAYFTTMLKYDEIIIESQENYQKQSYRNRCRILTANKIDDLIVPVIRGNSKTHIKEVQIDYNQKWIQRHWRAIKSGYGKSPFFEHYDTQIHQLIDKKHKYLFDKNLEIIETLVKLIDLKTCIKHNAKFDLKTEANNDDLRGLIHPKITPVIPGIFNPGKYTQLFGREFVANLSIIDLLFCEGPNADNILHSSIIP
jgi:hypothetical protein